MWPSVEPKCPKSLCTVQQRTSLKACTRGSAWPWLMLIALMVAILPWQIVAESSSLALATLPEQASGALRQGTVALTANLRASPSMHSEIIAVAKEGARVKIMLESGRWLQVRSEEGIEAWIYKTLVRIEPEALQSPDETAVTAAPSPLTETVAATVAIPDLPVESPPESTPEESASGAAPPAPVGDLHILPHMTWTVWIRDSWRSAFEGGMAYIILALIILLALSITLHLRATRQLRRVTREVRQILDLVEGMFAGGAVARTRDGGALQHPMTDGSLAQQPPPSRIEFSPIESIILEALSEQPEVQEADMAKVLAERGFVGVLTKAIIGNIVRKTGMTGLSWVEVRYVQGRYRYRLRPEAVPNLNAHALERLSGHHAPATK
jgi:SH3-like domain-containing protein